MLYIEETGRLLRTMQGLESIDMLLFVTNILMLGVIVFQTLKFEPSVPFLVATIAAKTRNEPHFQNI
jgi:hypothetical protein